MSLAPFKIKKVSEKLPCQLTDEERLNFGDMMATASQDVDAAESTKKSAVKQLNYEIQEAKTERDRLARIVNSRTEYRDVTVSVRYDYESGKVIKTRTDTGEIIEDRWMTDEEKQTSMLDDEDMGGE